MMDHPRFKSDDVLYAGLQNTHGCQRQFLESAGASCRAQTEAFVSGEDVRAFASRFGLVLVHFDTDALDENLFHSTCFANPELSGDGSGGGRMTMEQPAGMLSLTDESTEAAGLTAAEYLPFNQHRLHKTLSYIKIFREQREGVRQEESERADGRDEPEEATGIRRWRGVAT